MRGSFVRRSVIRRAVVAVGMALASTAMGCGGGSGGESTGPKRSDSSSSTAPPKNVVLNFCATDYPLWVAMQPKGGDWTRVLPDADRAFRFALGASGGVAVVWSDPFTLILYATAEEVNAAYGSCDPGSTVPLKVVSGTVAGVPAGDVAYVALGPADGAPAVGDSAFLVRDVPDGPRDLFAAHGRLGSASFTTSEFILRRGVNIAANGTVPRLDFRSNESFGAVAASISLANFVSPSLSVGLLTPSGIDEPLFYVPAAGAQQTVVGLPAARVLPGDLHEIDVVDPIARDETSSGSRFVNAFASAMTNRTLTLGPPIAQPAISMISETPYQRWRVFLTAQSEYGELAEVELDDDSGRGVTIIATRGYAAPGVAWELTIPEFKNINYSSAWGLPSGTVPFWFVAAVSGDGKIFQAPSDGTIVRGSTRSSLSGSANLAPRATTSSGIVPSGRPLRSLRQANRIDISNRGYRRQR
jgi:hypothetical protein